MSLVDQMVERSMAAAELVHQAQTMAVALQEPVEEFIGAAGELGLQEKQEAAAAIKENVEEAVNHLSAAAETFREVTEAAQSLGL